MHKIISLQTDDDTVYHIIIHNEDENKGLSVHDANGHFLGFISQSESYIFPGSFMKVISKDLTNPDPFLWRRGFDRRS